MPPHLGNRDKPPPHPPSIRVSNLHFFPLNTTDALSKMGESAIGAPRSERQSANTPIINGKRFFSAPIMKDKSADLPREGKKQENINLRQL